MHDFSNINKRLINQSEIARQINKSRTYVCLLLNGKRTNKEMIQKIKDIIEKQLKAA